MAEKGITGKDLAKKTGVSAQSISNIVKGTHFPKPELLEAMAKELDVDLPSMFETKKKRTPADLIEGIQKDLTELKKLI